MEEEWEMYRGMVEDAEKWYQETVSIVKRAEKRRVPVYSVLLLGLLLLLCSPIPYLMLCGYVVLSLACIGIQEVHLTKEKCKLALLAGMLYAHRQMLDTHKDAP